MDWPSDTDTEVVDVTNPATGQTWMDRNLGASRAATASNDEKAYGDLYQWGRAADGHQLIDRENNEPISGTTSTLSDSFTPGHGDFITNDSFPYYDWRSPQKDLPQSVKYLTVEMVRDMYSQNDDRWQGVNGKNNPCPDGYRLPTEAEWAAEIESWSSSGAAGAFDSPLKLPGASYRYHGSGSFSGDGSNGFYWSSTVDDTYSPLLLHFSSTNALIISGQRTDGLSVRCIKD